MKIRWCCRGAYQSAFEASFSLFPSHSTDTQLKAKKKESPPKQLFGNIRSFSFLIRAQKFQELTQDPASSVCIQFCIYWCFVVCIFLLVRISIVYVLQWHKHRSSTGVTNPPDLHFSSLTEALKPKLSIYLIEIFVHNMQFTNYRRLSSQYWTPPLAFMFLLWVLC